LTSTILAEIVIVLGFTILFLASSITAQVFIWFTSDSLALSSDLQLIVLLAFILLASPILVKIEILLTDILSTLPIEIMILVVNALLLLTVSIAKEEVISTFGLCARTLFRFNGCLYLAK